MESKPILLVDTDLVDKMMVKRTFKGLNVKNTLITFSTVAELIKYVRNKENPLPCIIFINSYTSKIEGIEHAFDLKKEGYLKTIPIVVFVCMGAWDIEEFRNIADKFIDKPLNTSRFLQIIKSLKFGWYLDDSEAMKEKQ